MTTAVPVARLAIAVPDLCAPICVAVVCKMKNTVKITACGVISALAVVLMMGTNIPILLYTVPALVGIFFAVPAIEFGSKWAFLCYGITSVLGIILPTEREALVVFIAILGYYPIVKMQIERIGKRALECVIKFVLFNVSIFAAYFVIVKVLGISVTEGSNYGLAVTAGVLAAAGNVAFVIYDFALTRIIRAYFFKFRKTVRKALGIKGKF